jgi:NAD(P)-dependent dehydrogenase (short-subunit alcohol dehydrogenase family)
VRPTPRTLSPVTIVTASRLDKLRRWAAENRLALSAGVFVVGVLSYRVYANAYGYHKKRKAGRSARNGGRVDVVLIAGGAPDLPLTRSLALDLERKGFIVYVVCSCCEDEEFIKSLSRPDIRAFPFDVTDPPNASLAIKQFAAFLTSPYIPVPRARPDYLTLKAIILIPALNYEVSPIALIPPRSFASVFNSHLLHPIITIQALLPLLAARRGPPGEPFLPPKLIVLTPSIISSIKPPFHAPEVVVCSALVAFIEVLNAELRPLSIPVTHIQLGTFEFIHSTSMQAHDAGVRVINGEERPPNTYSRTIMQNQALSPKDGARSGKGASLRHLQNTVFDVIDGSIAAEIIRVGLGASTYSLIGRWLPRTLVTWMMGIQGVDKPKTWLTVLVEEGHIRSFDEGTTPL